MPTPKTLWSRSVYRGKVVNLRIEELEFPSRRAVVEVVEHRGAVVIAAQPARDAIVLVEQYRYPLGMRQWEVPAGSIDPGEGPDACAARELREETGYRAERIRKLWSAYSAPGFCTELRCGRSDARRTRARRRRRRHGRQNVRARRGLGHGRARRASRRENADCDRVG